MSSNYKFHKLEGTYFVSFAVVEWLDVFTLLPRERIRAVAGGSRTYSWYAASDKIGSSIQFYSCISGFHFERRWYNF